MKDWDSLVLRKGLFCFSDSCPKRTEELTEFEICLLRWLIDKVNVESFDML